MKALLIALLLSMAAMPVLSQEICNNGVDDDADGLIDLNDTTDCVCVGMIGGGGEVSSIIPNPSFEEHDCVPASYSELNCATTWEQATNATSDYFLAGGYMPVVVPQPVPDGDGCVGGYIIRDYQGVGSHYEEYIGACLSETMHAGEEYSLRFHVAGQLIDGFLSQTFPITMGPINITLFGLQDCVPFPVGFDSGCPQGWTELGHVEHQPDGTWHEVTITFTPTTDINTVMIGGPCLPPADYVAQGLSELPYFFYDGLTLNESILFSSVTVTGSTCTNDIVLTGHPDSLATSFQWYQEGIAIVGQTDTILHLSDLGLEVGTYQFFSSVNDTACVIAEVVVGPPIPAQALVQASPTNGCPPLTVDFNDATSGDVQGCHWVFGDGSESDECDPTHIYTSAGTYDVTLTVTMANGCTYDSTYSELINVVPAPVASFTATPQPATPENPVITFTDNSTGDVVSWQWDFDTIPPFSSAAQDPVVTYPAQPGAWTVMLVVANAAGCLDTAFATIMVVPNGDLDMPNVFSPNGDGENDRFVPLDEFPGRAHLRIYNRWGQEIFSTSSITAGWTGSDVPDGTYYWIVENLEANNDKRIRTGHVTLLR